ncbi:Acyl-CoA N-acyltransferase [Pleurostoma richardsiae]|uniref:Acyl-CoA N-acyltransferase n=1 Tax=Pleurostoma richardsiae TaxID=41990 RepID=A0AA38VBA8_9PEZI|nr:Acyl-CoA N-acyltransferase [Pleurostoma richardsiae]
MPRKPDAEAESRDGSVEDSDGAVDDGDLDDDFIMIQRTISQKRREKASECSITKRLPFTFAPNIRPLSVSDLQSCIALENAAFPHPEHRCSPEKFEYRLTTCPELSIGVFCTVVPSLATGFYVETLATANKVETDRADGAVSVLLAHIVATASFSETVTDADMDYPRDWRSTRGKRAPVGHQEGGRTVCLHSLAVVPKLQNCGLGQLIMKAYLQQVRNLDTADRVALICQAYLVSYYQRLGFKHLGESKATFGGGGWHDMVFHFTGLPKVTYKKGDDETDSPQS